MGVVLGVVIVMFLDGFRGIGFFCLLVGWGVFEVVDCG